MNMQRGRFKWMAWWYAALAIGFALLAAVHVLSRDTFWGIAVRVTIACGFALLSFAEFRGKKVGGHKPKSSG